LKPESLGGAAAYIGKRHGESRRRAEESQVLTDEVTQRVPDQFRDARLLRRS